MRRWQSRCWHSWRSPRNHLPAGHEQNEAPVITDPHAFAAAPLGRVVFVGSGPGDPQLLTLGAVAALADADVVLLDHDGLRPVLEHPLVRLTVGAIVSSLATPDQQVTPPPRAGVVAEAALGGRRVVRLVQGDPFLDGAVGDEAAACVKQGIDFEVIPGVSSLTAVPEYAGISLGQGDVQLVNVPDGEFCEEQAAHWTSSGTLVVSTRAEHVPALVECAVAAGRPGADAIMIIFRGGSTAQSSVEATLADPDTALSAVAAVSPDTPVHVMVGAAVADDHRVDLDWYESKPLFGWRVLVPRTKDQAGPLTTRLHSYGAHSEEVPTIAVEPPRTPQQMERAVRGLVEGRYEWVAFTSSNAVRAVREKFEAYGLDARSFSGLKVAAVGDATAKRLREWGIEPDLVPSDEQSAAGLAAEFPPYDADLDPINRVLLPRADIATETLMKGLTDLGWEVEDVTAYRTVRAAPPPAEMRTAIKTGQFDAVVFTSSSTVRNLVGIAGKPHAATIVAAIGPQTARTCEEHGLRVDVMAERPGAAELADALASFAAARRAGLIERGEPVSRPSQRRTRRRSSAS